MRIGIESDFGSQRFQAGDSLGGVFGCVGGFGGEFHVLFGRVDLLVELAFKLQGIIAIDESAVKGFVEQFADGPEVLADLVEGQS